MTTVNAEKIAKRIDELPPMPLVVQKLLKVVGNDFSSAKDIAATLSMDQALTSKVLKLVNSAFYGLPGKVSTITRAVVILGNAAVRNLALAFASFDGLKKLKGPLDQERFWDHNLTCAVGAQALAPSLKYPEPEEAFIAGLLHDIGHVVLSTTFPEEYGDLLCNIRSNFLDREEEIFGMTHADVGTRLLEHWQIPDSLCRVTRFHHSSKLASAEKEPLVTLVMLSDVLASVRRCLFAEVVDESLLMRITADTGISMGEYGKVLALMDDKIKEARVFLSIAEHRDLGKVSAPSGAEMATVAVIGDDGQRILWMKGLLESFGYHVLVWDHGQDQSFVWDAVQLAIFDLQSIPEQEIHVLTESLHENNVTGITIAGYGDQAFRSSSDLKGLPVLPFIFTRQDIGKYLMKETADVG